jgi:DNA-binding IscR family transcriptional regulator
MPASGRIDRRYCRPSCRTLAYRQRRCGRRNDRGSLLDVVRALEQRLAATAAELLDIRQRFASELGHDAARVTLANVVAARERDAAALKTALREQESQHQHLVTLEGQRNALRSEVAELTQRIEQTQRAKQQREQELLDELRRQREHYESLREPSAPLYPPPVNRPTPPEPPPWVPQSGSSTVRSPEPSAYSESRVERSPAEPPRLAKPPKPSVRAEPASQKDERSHGKPEPPRRVPKWPRIEQFAERTMRRRMPEYIKLQRPDLRRDLQYELTGEEGPLHTVARLLSRLIFVGLSRGQAAGDVPGFAAACVDKLYRHLAADPVDQAVCGQWPREEREAIQWLAYQLVVAMMGDFGRLNE